MCLGPQVHLLSPYCVPELKTLKGRKETASFKSGFAIQVWMMNCVLTGEAPKENLLIELSCQAVGKPCSPVFRSQNPSSPG